MQDLNIVFGSDLLSYHKPKISSWGRVTLLCNHSSLGASYEYSPLSVSCFLGDKLRSLHSPQHGFWGTEQDNMLETSDSFFSPLSLPVYSLYHSKREPDERSLADVDTILVDIQIVGCRVYTFKWTIFNCLLAAKKLKKKVVILDRPNPLGGEVLEGSVLKEEAFSFVGLLPIPMRHGLTVGEFAKLANKNIGAELEILPIKNWKASSFWSEYRDFWPFTSPNLPSFSSVILYPGFVLFEGTNISEGRGTTLPFQIIGAPYIKEPEKLIKKVLDYTQNDDSVFLKPTYFKPTFNKWKDEVCGGIQVIIKDAKRVRSYKLALSILKSVLDLYGKYFNWTEPPYEYELYNRPINLILGSNDVAQALVNKTPDNLFWSEGIEDFKKNATSIYLYERVLNRAS